MPAAQYQTVMTPSLWSSEWEIVIRFSLPTDVAKAAASPSRASQLANALLKTRNETCLGDSAAAAYDAAAMIWSVIVWTSTSMSCSL